jgi:hypothetical protein
LERARHQFGYTSGPPASLATPRCPPSDWKIVHTQDFFLQPEISNIKQTKSKQRRASMAEILKETHSLGEVNVPADKLWGAQTQGSLEHFSIGKDLIPREMSSPYAILKKAAADAASVQAFAASKDFLGLWKGSRGDGKVARNPSRENGRKNPCRGVLRA